MAKKHDDPTTFQVDLDDETMERVLKQSVAARMPPRQLLSVVVRGLFAQAAASGTVLLDPPSRVPSTELH